MGDTERRATESLQDKSLLGLSVAITGKEVDMDTVQVLDPEPFGKIMNWMVQGMNESLKNNALALDICTVRGWEQDDGSLIVRLLHKSVVNDEFRIPQGHWQPATPEAMKQAGLNLDSPEGAALLKELADSAVAMHEKAKHAAPRPSADELADMVDSVFLVIGKAPAGMHFMKSLATNHPELVDGAESWIRSGAKYFTAVLERNGTINQSNVRLASAEDELMGILARTASVSPDVTKTAISVCGVGPEFEQATYALWSSLNGNMGFSRQ